MQGTLFDTADTDLASTGYSGEQLAGVDRDALGNLAFLYTASEKGNSSGIRFAATGCKKIALWELPSVLARAGVEVLNAPRKPGRFSRG